MFVRHTMLDDRVEGPRGAPAGAAGCDKLIVELIVSETSLSALEAEWRALEPLMPAIPFVHYDWLVPWWTHMSAHKASVADELCVCTVRSRMGELLGVAPLMITHRPSVGPLRFRQLQFFGADPNITEVRGVAAASENTGLVYSAVVEHLRRFPLQWDVASLGGLPPDDARLAAEIDQFFPAHVWLSDLADPILYLKPTWEEFNSTLSRNVKESLRKCYNAPKAHGLSFEFHVIERQGEVDAALARFFELHHARSEMTGTIKHRNCFAATRAKRFLTDVCARFARRGMLRVFQIRCGGVVIATRIGFVFGDSMYLYYSGFDPAYRRYSVMTRVLAESIKYAIAAGMQSINLSTGVDVSKTRWSPRTTTYRAVEFSCQSRLALLKHDGFRAVSRRLRRGAAPSWLSRILVRGVD